jgi:hypothetical protein
MMNLLAKLKQRWYIVLAGGTGFAIHLGTAILRLDTFFPYPRMVDFAGFYTASYALRLGLSPYTWPPGLIETLRAERALLFTPPVIYNPPVWPWLLQPFTLLSFPAAAYIWLAMNLALLAYSSILLARIAGAAGRGTKALVFLLVLTFGPVFLDLTLGQTSVLLLVATLLIGQALQTRRKAHRLLAALIAGVAAGAKLFPLAWLGAPAVLRRWRLTAWAVLIVAVVFGIGFIVAPDANRDYFQHLLHQRISSAFERVSIDDQSLPSWLDRLGRPQVFQVPGLSATQQTTVTWSPPWSIAPETLRWIGYAIALLLALPPLAVMLRARERRAEGLFYLWVLTLLLPLPHIERYNHALLLPAIAWLWGRGGHGQALAALSYTLAGLSRLNHLWAILLPAPWGPLASGFGICAVLVLYGGILASTWPYPTITAMLEKRRQERR